MRILIVEDEVGTRGVLATLLASKGYQTSVAGSAEGAIDVMKSGCNPAVALVDLDLPGMSGAEFIGHLKRDAPDVFPILISAAETDRVARVISPAVTRLRKPLDVQALLTILDQYQLSS